MTSHCQPEPPDEIATLETPPNKEVYIAALERALRETTYALMNTGRRQTELQQRLAAIRRVLKQPISPTEAIVEVRRILDSLHLTQHEPSC